MTYTIYYDVPYEGKHDVQCGTLEEVKDWLRDNRSCYDFNLDNIEVIPSSNYIDVYELMRD